MPFCTGCGKEVDASAAFCSACGASLLQTRPQTPPLYNPTSNQFANRTTNQNPAVNQNSAINPDASQNPDANQNSTTNQNPNASQNTAANPNQGQPFPQYPNYGQYAPRPPITGYRPINSSYVGGYSNYGAQQSVPYYKSPARPKYITFIFVTTLIFMILWSFESFMAIFDLISEYGIEGVNAEAGRVFDRYLYSEYVVSVSTLLVTAVAMVMFIFALTAKNADLLPAERVKHASRLFVMVFVTLAVAIVFLFMQSVRDLFFSRAIDAGCFEEDVLYSTTIGEDMIYVAFCLANVFKATGFRRESIAALGPR